MADDPFAHVTVLGRWGAGRAMMDTEINQLATPVWPTANLAFYYPMVLPMSITLRRFIIAWAGAGGGPNYDVGLYTDAGVQLAHSGTTVRGVNLEHVAPTGGVISVPRGHYYIGLVLSSVGADQEFGYTWGTVGQIRMTGALQQAAAGPPLPATMTGVAVAAYLSVPAIGLCQSATV